MSSPPRNPHTHTFSGGISKNQWQQKQQTNKPNHCALMFPTTSDGCGVLQVRNGRPLLVSWYFCVPSWVNPQNPSRLTLSHTLYGRITAQKIYSQQKKVMTPINFDVPLWSKNGAFLFPLVSTESFSLNFWWVQPINPHLRDSAISGITPWSEFIILAFSRPTGQKIAF